MTYLWCFTPLWISSDSIVKSKTAECLHDYNTWCVCVCLCVRGSLLLKCVLAALLASSVFPVVGTDRAKEGDRGREKISAALVLNHSGFFLQLSL